MLKISNKLVLLLLSFLSLILLSSCSYENTTINLGSGFDSTWTFSNSSDYEFDENLVEVVNGKAQLKVLDLEHSGDDFNSGSHMGTFYNDSEEGLTLNSQNFQRDLGAVLSTKASQLLGYWRMESGAADQSGNLNHGVLVGDASLSAQAKVGVNSIALDGENDRISLPDNSTYWLPNSDFTLSGWVYPAVSGISRNIWDLDSGRSASALNRLGVTVFINSSDKINFYLVTDGGVLSHLVSNTTVQANEWTHITVVRSAGLQSIYINGQLDISAPCPVDNVDYDGNYNNDQVSIGEFQRSGISAQETWNGRLDEMSMWSTALSSSEVEKIYLSSDFSGTELSPAWTPKYQNIVGYWKMDGDWLDSSGKGNHGSAVLGDATFLEESQVGDQSGTFDGTADRVGFLNNSGISYPDDSFSYLGWFKANSLAVGTRSGIIGIIRTGAEFSTVYIDSTNQLFFGSWDTVSGINMSTSGENYYDDSWHHFAAIRDNANDRVMLYVDGELKASAVDTRTGTFITTPSFLLYGADAAGATFHGEIDDLSHWDTSLTSSEVRLIYERQKQKFAASFESEVIDLGGETAVWPGLAWLTNLPYGKDLVGDYNDDGTTDSESPINYSSLGFDHGLGLIGYWPLNEVVLNSVSGSDFKDKSMNINDGNELGGVQLGQRAQFSRGAFFDGLDDTVSLANMGDFSSGVTTSAWVKVKAANDLDNTQVVMSQRTNTDNYDLQMTIALASNEFRCYFENSTVTSSSSFVLTGDLQLGEWYHYSCVFSPAAQTLTTYVNGKAGAPVSVGVNAPPNTGGSAYLGSNNGSSSYFHGLIDEFAIWNRDLTASEIQGLYLRGGNRIKLQVKSCVDSTCHCKSYSVAPQGSAIDCDGDGTLNASDTDDSHRANFIGPGGDGTTFYSELFNRNPLEIVFNCGLNTSDSDIGVCVDDEIALAGSSKPTRAEFLNTEYTQFVAPPTNRYAKYRVYIEAEGNFACDNEPCLPYINSVSLDPSLSVKYASDPVEIKPKKPVVFKKLLGVDIQAEACASFRAGRGGVSYYHNGTEWQLATESSHMNSQNTFTNNITQFAAQFGAGELEVLAYLNSNSLQTQNCTIDEVDVFYE